MTQLVFPIAIANRAETQYALDQRQILAPYVGRVIALYARFAQRFDAVPRDIIKALADLRAASKTDIRRQSLERLIEQVTRMFDDNNRIQVDRQLFAIRGINSAISEAAERQVQKHIKRNIGYITALDSNTKRQIRAIVSEAFIKKMAVERLQDSLIERVGVAERHAKLIARDQGNKFFGALTRARHEDAGAKKYIWSTSLDERVRAAHAALHGQEFSYAEGSPEGNPGEPIQCRCTAIPVFD